MPYGFLQDLNSSCSFMSKGLKIVSVCLEFAAFAAVGYFLGGMFLSDRTFDKVEYAEPEPLAEAPVEEIVVVSTVPVLLAEDISAPSRGSDGKYSFKASAAVESGDSLEYVLYADEHCSKMVAANNDGEFIGVKGSESSRYYLAVQNKSTEEWSELIGIDGFKKINMVSKITWEELNQIINVERTTTGASGKKIQHRHKNLKLEIRGSKSEASEIMTIADLCAEMSYYNVHNWTFVTVHEPEPQHYDAEGYLTKVVVTVGY